VKSAPSGVSKADANHQLRSNGFSNFKQIIYAITVEELEDVWQEVLNKYAEHAAWIKYLTSEWYSKEERWSMAY